MNTKTTKLILARNELINKTFYGSLSSEEKDKLELLGSEVVNLIKSSLAIYDWSLDVDRELQIVSLKVETPDHLRGVYLTSMLDDRHLLICRGDEIAITVHMGCADMYNFASLGNVIKEYGLKVKVDPSLDVAVESGYLQGCLLVIRRAIDTVC